jgi:hypothetical protein
MAFPLGKYPVRAPKPNAAFTPLYGHNRIRRAPARDSRNERGRECLRPRRNWITLPTLSRVP